MIFFKQTVRLGKNWPPETFAHPYAKPKRHSRLRRRRGPGHGYNRTKYRVNAVRERIYDNILRTYSRVMNARMFHYGTHVFGAVGGQFKLLRAETVGGTVTMIICGYVRAYTTLL